VAALSTLSKDVETLAALPRWDLTTPLHVVNRFDVLKYSILSTIASQESWMRDVIRNLYVMADFESGSGPFDEPTAVERARTLLAQVGVTGPLNQLGEADESVRR